MAMSIFRFLIVVWAALSLAGTVYLVDSRSYLVGVSRYYLLEHLFVPIIVTGLLASFAIYKQWLDIPAGLVSIAVGMAHGASHFCLLFALLAFFVSSSIATKVGKRVKKRMDPTYQKGGRRDMVQVFSNGAVATTACLGFLFFAAPGTVGTETLNFQDVYMDTLCAVAAMAALAGCCGDTWASEFGILQGSILPRHIITWRTVPAGTNGGVTIIGTLCSCLGGLLVGVAFFFGMSLDHMYERDFAGMALSSWPAIPLGAFAGFLCSLIDSILGATLQYSGRDTDRNCVVNQPGPGVERITGRHILSNHAVNFISSLLTAIIVAYLVYLRSPQDYPLIDWGPVDGGETIVD